MRAVRGLACLILMLAPALAQEHIATTPGCASEVPRMPRTADATDPAPGADPNLWLPKLEPVIKAPFRAAGPCR